MKTTLVLTNDELGVLANMIVKNESILTIEDIRTFKNFRKTILETAKDFLQKQYEFKEKLSSAISKYEQDNSEKNKKEVEKIRKSILDYNSENLKKENIIEADIDEVVNFLFFCWNKSKFSFVDNENDAMYREIILSIDEKLLQVYEKTKHEK